MGLLFSFSGRIGRARFWLVILVATLVCCGIAVLSIQYYVHSTERGADAVMVAGLLVAIVGWKLSVLSAMARRLHDLDCSGWWALLLLPVAGFSVVILGAIPTRPGPNRFGPDPQSPGTVVVG